MKIIKNDKPLWTREHLAHYQKYRDVYGLELTNAEIEQEIRLLDCGSPGRRYSPETFCFDIYTAAGELAGDITLTPVDRGNDSYEVNIVIFDQYSGRGYAQEAVAELIALAQSSYNIQSIEAVVKSTNPEMNAARRILEKQGFVYKLTLPGGGLLFSLESGGPDLPERSLDIMRTIKEYGGFICTGSCKQIKKGQLHCRNLGNMLGIPPSVIWERINALSAQGYLVRDGDKIPITIILTPKGDKILGELSY